MKNNYKYLLGLVLLVLLSGCRISSSLVGSPQGEENNIIPVSDEDPEMNAAIQEAQDTLNEFLEVLQAPKPGQEYFLVKARFSYDGGAEHIWLADVTYQAGDFIGMVANEPVYISDLSMGEEVSIPRSDITDWMYVENGKLVGGYTIRMLRDRLSPQEREQFDQEFEFVVED